MENNNSNNISNFDRASGFLAPTPSLGIRNEFVSDIRSTSDISRGFNNNSHYLEIGRQASNIYGGASSFFAPPLSPLLSNNINQSTSFIVNPTNIMSPSSGNLFMNGFMDIGNRENNTSLVSIQPRVNSLCPTPASVSFFQVNSTSNLGPNSTRNLNNNSHQNQNNSSERNENRDNSDISNLDRSIRSGTTDENDMTLHLPESCMPKLQNIVSTADLQCALDLRKIALQAKNAEYNPKRFAAVIMRIREPKTTALIFASGKMVCTGARSEQDSKKAARQYAKMIQKLGFPVRFTSFTIQNIVGSCDVNFKISLEGLNLNNTFCNYEPEVFPGLIFRMKNPKIVLLIFVSGKVVLTGAKQKEQIFEAFRNIYPILEKYKKTDLIPSNNVANRHNNNDSTATVD